jgi:type VI secretion system secreted protein Hcp
MTFGAPAAFGALGITGVSFGASNPYVDVSGGGGAGKLTLSEVSVSRYADAASPLLLQGIAQGRHYQTVVIVVGGGAITYTLEDVTITSFQQSVGADASESLTLHYSRLTVAAGGNSTSVQSTSVQ